MGTLVTFKCDLGHAWISPMGETGHLVIPDRCPKCVGRTDTAIIAVVVSGDNGSTSIKIVNGWCRSAVVV